jgi:hypothetical protein
MSASTPIEIASLVLSDAGFRRITGPLKIAGLPFDFPAVFVGVGKSPDLIAVVDTAFEAEAKIEQNIQGFARALDVLKSRRPITLVVTGPRPSASALEAMSSVCRVLVADDTANAERLKDSLAVLLPLNLPNPRDGQADAASGLAQLDRSDPLVNALLVASVSGRAAVEKKFIEAIEEPFLQPEAPPKTSRSGSSRRKPSTGEP